MKRNLLLLSFLGLYICSYAQPASADSWKITWSKKVILQTSETNESANVRTIKASDLKKNFILEISYKEADVAKEKEWIRSFMLFDENDQQLLKKDSTRHVKITAAQLKKLFGNKKKIKIYTIAIPSDPDLAARVRVRRMHLCTLQLQ